MQYAFIPTDNISTVPCIFEIAVGGWQLERLESDGSTKLYTGLKGDSFTKCQLETIQTANGSVFDSESDANAWLIANGVIQIDFF